MQWATTPRAIVGGWQVVDLDDKATALVSKAHHRVVAVAHGRGLDVVLVLELGSIIALSATVGGVVQRQVLVLDIALMREGNDDRLARH